MIVESAKEASTWYSQTPDEVARALSVDPASGLSAAEAQARLERYGPNKLATKKKESGWAAFLRQYHDFMQILLLAAAAVSFIVTRQLGTSLLLIGLTIFNAILGLQQESKAAADVAALEKMLKRTARVRRDGQAIEIDADNVVPGEIALIEAGDLVPADGRLFVAANLEIEEAALTGESTPVLKDTASIAKADVGLGDRLCLAYMNTSVTRGRGEMIVTATGMDTEFGHIADLLNKTEAGKTPLQKQLDRLTVTIAALAGMAFLLTLILGLQRGQDFNTLFLAGVALAIAAIPTGLPAVVTTLYSRGTRILASQNAIVKRLPSVETLGSVSAICSDKTGTLTLNKMTARELVVPGQNRFKITGEGYSTDGQLLSAGGAKIDLDAVLLPMVLCADARLDGDSLIGDPTEGALIVLAAKGGIDPDGARQVYPRIGEVPFDSANKFMATFHNMTNEQGRPVVRCFVKGAMDVLLARGASYWLPGGEVRPITAENRRVALAENERIAGAGERVIAVAQRDLDPQDYDPNEDLLKYIEDLTLLAMVGIVDPPRAEVKPAISKSKSAGIQIRMITGDHAATAAAIAQQLGIEGKALTGAQFAALSDEDLRSDLNEIGVVARVEPEDKIRLVRTLQEQGHIVAMTGDGINDAPALKKADIGVAMGITGTEVSKEAAVMVLTDDNFATIVKAVEYGRALYDNLIKYIRFQMTALVAFIGCFLIAGLFGIAGGIPFTPLVILWINFLVQVPIAIYLGFDRPSHGLMERKPRPSSQPVLSRSQWTRIILMGVLVSAATVILEAYYQPEGIAVAFTMAFVVFSLLNIAIGVSCRSETETAFDRDTFGDLGRMGLIGIALLSILLPTGLDVFRNGLTLTNLTGEQWLLCIGVALGYLLVDEVVKLFLRRRGRRAKSVVG
jgi:Ca2+-transporting ATPase